MGAAFQSGRYSFVIHRRDFRRLCKCDLFEKKKPGNWFVSIDWIVEKYRWHAFLIIENILLSAGALIIGIGAGMLVSRVFLLLLMKLIGS